MLDAIFEFFLLLFGAWLDPEEKERRKQKRRELKRNKYFK